jgi:hypothetical protein
MPFLLRPAKTRQGCSPQTREEVLLLAFAHQLEAGWRGNRQDGVYGRHEEDDGGGRMNIVTEWSCHFGGLTPKALTVRVRSE